MWSAVADPRGPPARRPHPAGARRPQRPQALGHRPLGARRDRAEPRDASSRSSASAASSCRRSSCRATSRPTSGCGRTRSSHPSAACSGSQGASPLRPTRSTRTRSWRPWSAGTAYVVIGAFARIVQGAEETTDGIDIAPSLRGDNLRRLGLALDDLGAAPSLDGQPVALDERHHEAPAIEFGTPTGKLKVVPEPAGTRGGYDDLRRAARASRSARAFASRSRRPPTSPACSPPSDARKTCRSSSPSAASRHSSTRSAEDVVRLTPERAIATRYSPR